MGPKRLLQKVTAKTTRRLRPSRTLQRTVRIIPRTTVMSGRLGTGSAPSLRIRCPSRQPTRRSITNRLLTSSRRRPSKARRARTDLTWFGRRHRPETLLPTRGATSKVSASLDSKKRRRKRRRFHFSALTSAPGCASAILSRQPRRDRAPLRNRCPSHSTDRALRSCRFLRRTPGTSARARAHWRALGA